MCFAYLQADPVTPKNILCKDSKTVAVLKFAVTRQSSPFLDWSFFHSVSLIVEKGFCSNKFLLKLE